jgi:hypothetical protein
MASWKAIDSASMRICSVGFAEVHEVGAGTTAVLGGREVVGGRAVGGEDRGHRSMRQGGLGERPNHGPCPVARSTELRASSEDLVAGS